MIELAEPAEGEALRRERTTLVIEVEAYKAIAARPRKPTLPQPDDDGGTDGTAA